MSTRYWHPFANMATLGEELVLARGDGCTVWDEQGRAYLDAAAGLWFCHVGWGRQTIVEAAREQLAALPTYSTFGRYATRPALDLSERLAALAPLPDARVFLGLGGSDAVETAAKLAHRYWAERGQPERSLLVSRDNAYHGMHAYATSLGGMAVLREGYGTLVPDVLRVRHDDAAELGALLERRGGEVAAVIAEPVIGAGGVLPPPDDAYWPAVAALCREHDVLLICDEVITGCGRIGHWWGCQRYGFEPDLVVFAKGVTSGYLPLGGVLVGPRLQEVFWEGDGAMVRHGYTYSGHGAACAAALANLQIVEEEELGRRVLALEPVLRRELDRLETIPLVSEARSVGLMAAIELDAAARADDPALAERVVRAAAGHGVLTRVLAGRALQLSPALTVEEHELRAMVDGLGAALVEEGAALAVAR